MNTVRLTPLTCGWFTVRRSFLLAGTTGDLTAPVTAYLVEHPAGLALVDTGLSSRFARPVGAPQTAFADIEEDGTVGARLRALGIDPADVRFLLNTHLHMDHAGGNDQLPNAHLVTQRSEWEFAHSDVDRFYQAAEFDTGQPVVLIDGEHDVFGDGSVRLIPTPGHTPGHQSAIVQTEAGEVVVCGDACNLAQAVDDLHLPDHAADMDDYRESLEKFRALRAAGATLCYSHDPEFWAGIVPGTPWPSRPS
jgi:glyoxylase-like metal-dependent hydrolase (beta-lactamase superfamily II)